MGRFINADGLIGETGDLLGHNMFAYCGNNPVMMVDPSGYLPNWLKVAGTVAIVGGLIAAAVIVGGPVLIGAAIGATVGTAIGAGVGYAVNGKQGAIDGAAIGALAGAAVGAFAGTTYSFLSTTKVVEESGIMIGQSMSRVLPAAEKMGLGTYSGLRFYNSLVKISPRLANAVGWLNNKMWLANNVNAGKTVYSVGFDPSKNPQVGSYIREIGYLVQKGIEYIVTH